MNKLHGLTNEQVELSRLTHGENKIEKAEPKKFWKEWLSALDDPMLKLLLAIVGVYIVLAILNLSDWGEPICILGSIMLGTYIASKNAMTSDKEYQKNKEANSHVNVTVYRNGEAIVIDSEEIVVDDLVLLQSGDKILADGYMWHGDIKVNNSALNGESNEVKKFAPKQGEFDPNSREMTNHYTLLGGALVVDGEGVMRVTNVGMNTLVGEMAKEMNEEQLDSPLKVKLTQFAKYISLFGYIGAPIVCVGMIINSITSMGLDAWINQPLPVLTKVILGAISIAISIVVMAVPEGLPLMISTVLQQNTSKMLKHNILVRKDVGIETAGSLNILFSDKTGTITKGELEVVKFIDGLGNEYNSINELPNVLKEVVSDNLHINNGAKLIDGVATKGNMTDRAMLNYVKDLPYNDLTVVKVETFNSSNKYMATQTLMDGGVPVTFYKGAVEKVLDKCVNVNSDDVALINQKVKEMTSASMRVLALATCFDDFDKITEGEIPNTLVLNGVVGIRDDVREEAKLAIEDAHKAGVQVVMITGDIKETAQAIAKECGLLVNDSDIVLTSSDLQAMSDDEIKLILPNLRVVARALPTDKSRMVRLAQELGLVVGATGDGVNDSVMLKRADVGFAMGKGGTDAAKEASDIVIQDDNLKSIVDSIWYGRTIYNNILKFIMFQLTINVVAVFVCATSPFFGIHEPLTVIQLIILNLICDTLGAMALGGEPALKEYMLEKPKSRTQSIVSKRMLTQIFATGGYMILISMAFLFASDIQAMFGEAHLTGYFALFVLMSVMNGFNVRSNDSNVFKGLKDNPIFVWVMLAIVGIVVLMTIVGGSFMGLVPLTLMQWGIIFIISLSVVLFGSLLKSTMNKFSK